jgi:hypothetical protein
MFKKLISTSMASAAFIFLALPGIAAAASDPQLTHPTGTLLQATHANPVKLKATNIGHVLFRDATGETVYALCDKSELTGKLTANTGGASSRVEFEIETATFTEGGEKGDCFSPTGSVRVTTTVGEGVPWCVRAAYDMNEDEFWLYGGGCTDKSIQEITFVLDHTSLGIECKYTRDTKNKFIVGEHSTDIDPGEDAELWIKQVEFVKEAGSFLCPSKGFLDATYTVETDTGETADPVWIS